MKPYFKRIVLKISGETISGEGSKGVNAEAIEFIANELYEAYISGVQVAVVVGGGNWARGNELIAQGFDAETSHKIGMLTTTINALLLQDKLKEKKVPAEVVLHSPLDKEPTLPLPVRVATALQMADMGEYYISQKVRDKIEYESALYILACGTGKPYFSTDTAAVLRALELKADLILKATKVDGVYSKDPREPGAEILKNPTPEQLLQLSIIDKTATSLLMEHKIPFVVFRVFDKGNLKRVLFGDKSVGSWVVYQ